MTDFGKHIIPRAIDSHRVYSHVYQGYWEDIGTIRSFFEANLDMVNTVPRFDFSRWKRRFTRGRVSCRRRRSTVLQSIRR